MCDKDTSPSVRSDNSPVSSAAVPVRLPALDGARQPSKDELRTDDIQFDDKPTTVTNDEQLGSVESIKMQAETWIKK